MKEGKGNREMLPMWKCCQLPSPISIGKWILAIVATFACCDASVANAVTVCYEGRLLSEYGVVLSSQSKNAVVCAYDGETTGANLLDSAQTTIKTDANGLFAVTAELGIPSSNSVFWVGVNVDGIDIKPRMRVNPAPFALVAAEAERIESEGAVKLSGNVAVGSVSNGAAAVSAMTVALGGDTVVRGDVENAGDVYIGAIDASRGNVGMMRSAKPGNITTTWNDFTGDEEFSVTTGSAWFSTSGRDWRSVTASDDGFAMVMVKADVGNSESSTVDVSIHNGDVAICSMDPSDSTDAPHFAAGTDTAGTSVVRMFTFPVRRGKNVNVDIMCSKGVLSSAAATVAAKVRIVCFGAGK